MVWRAGRLSHTRTHTRVGCLQARCLGQPGRLACCRSVRRPARSGRSLWPDLASRSVAPAGSAGPRRWAQGSAALPIVIRDPEGRVGVHGVLLGLRAAMADGGRPSEPCVRVAMPPSDPANDPSASEFASHPHGTRWARPPSTSAMALAAPAPTFCVWLVLPRRPPVSLLSRAVPFVAEPRHATLTLAASTCQPLEPHINADRCGAQWPAGRPRR